MRKIYRDYIDDILNAIEDIQEFTKNIDFKKFSQDKKTYYATIRSLEIIGEAANKIPKSIREKFPKIPWKEMILMRNKLIHEYFDLDKEIIWETIKKDILFLKKEILKNYDDLKKI